MTLLQDVDIPPLEPRRFESVLDIDRFERFLDAVVRALELLDDRVVWNVNSTAKGGGVAEMLRSLIAYARGAGVDARWVVIEGDPDFFRVTKRIHNNLHGSPGDGGDLDAEEKRIYDRALEPNAREFVERMSSQDIVLLHDPQTAGLIPHVKATGAKVIWRCHVGLDMPNDLARRAWRFLIPHVMEADACVFSRRAFAWEGLEDTRLEIIPPSIDAFSPKNQDLGRDNVAAILEAADLVPEASSVEPTFTRVDGSRARVERIAKVVRSAPPPSDARLVVQVSRWDRLKDPVGVIEGFGNHMTPSEDVHLVLAGPSVEAVADDPEGAEVFDEAVAARDRLPTDIRNRVHLANLPMEDGEENAAIVNALQRRADIVVQKSLAEGFGLTVAEAMWKGRPVVASRIGGIQDQIVDGQTGVLVTDPTDLDEFAAAITGVLDDPVGAERIGTQAQLRVRDEFLGPRHLMQYVDLFARLLQNGT